MNVEELKKMAGEKAVEEVRDGMVVGLGTGSTAYFSIMKLGELVKEGLDIIAIPTSKSSENLARTLGIPLSTMDEHPRIDVDIDGADEITDTLDLIKGLGGALVREKIVAKNAKKVIIVADASKRVARLGEKAPVPVEVVPFGRGPAERRLGQLAKSTALRVNGTTPFTSDNGNYIIDCTFESINDAEALGQRINDIEGVVDHGLFLNIADIALIAAEDGLETIKR